MLGGITESTECAQTQQNLQANRSLLLDIVDPTPRVEWIESLNLRPLFLFRVARGQRIPGQLGLFTLRRVDTEKQSLGYSHHLGGIGVALSGHYANKNKLLIDKNRQQSAPEPVLTAPLCLGRKTFTCARSEPVFRRFPSFERNA